MNSQKFESNSQKVGISKGRYLTTKEFAQRLNIDQRAVRNRLSAEGHYFGIRPLKGPNRLLYWPESAINELLQPDLQ